MKTFRLLVIIACIIGIVMAIYGIRQQKQIAHLEEKAKRLRNVCMFAKITLESDIRELGNQAMDEKFPTWRPHIVEQIFSNNHPGDDPNTLDACLTKPFDVEQLKHCKYESTDKYQCLIALLRDTVSSIALE